MTCSSKATSAAPSIATSIKRDREEELIRRGKQYQRGIQLFYRKFGRFPSSLDELQNTNNMRFLRHKYEDPITRKDEWRLIRFGQAKPRTTPAYLTGRQGGGQPGAGQPQQGVLPGSSASSSLTVIRVWPSAERQAHRTKREQPRNRQRNPCLLSCRRAP